MSEEKERLPPFLRRVREAGAGADDEDADAEQPDAGGDERSSPSGDGSAREQLQRALLDVGERVDEILGEAESAAGEIRTRAEAEGDAYLEERRAEAEALEAETRKRIDEALGELRLGVDRIAGESERLVGALREATDRAAQAAAPEAMPPEPRPVAYPGRDEEADETTVSESASG